MTRRKGRNVEDSSQLGLSLEKLLFLQVIGNQVTDKARWRVGQVLARQHLPFCTQLRWRHRRQRIEFGIELRLRHDQATGIFVMR